MNNRILMHNPPFTRAKLLDMTQALAKEVPQAVAEINPRLRGGLALVLVFIGDDYRPFVWVENSTGVKVEKYRSLIGQEVELVPWQDKQEKPEHQQEIQFEEVKSE